MNFGMAIEGLLPLHVGMLMLAAALIPLALMATTCMLKLSLVFAILRTALGAGQVPSAAIATVLSIVLSCYIMAPVAREVLQEFEQEPRKELALSAMLEDAERISQPLHRFMTRHVGEREALFFISMQAKGEYGSVETMPWPLLIPAFVLSELRAGLLLGCAIFLPFLVIDLIVANLLVGLGMVMVSPMQISLPLKLLLFTVCDGWVLLSESLILSYHSGAIPHV